MTPSELKFIYDNRGSHDKAVCKQLQRIREKHTGVSEGLLCHCKRSARKIYVQEWYEWFDKHHATPR